MPMKTTVALLALLALAGTASAEDVLRLDATATITGFDPALDGERSLMLRVHDDAGVPAADLHVDGSPALP